MKMIKMLPKKYVDNFGRPGYERQTIKTALASLFFWLMVIFPFIFLLISLLFASKSSVALRIITFTGLFFGAWCIILGLLSFILTILNNLQINRQAHRKITYNKVGVDKKEAILNRYFAQKFGDNRYEQYDYVLDPDNNIPLNEFMRLYQQKRVDKRDGS